LAVLSQGVRKNESSKAQLLIQVKDSTPTSAAAGTIVDVDPPLVDHPLVVSAANVSEEAAVETSVNL
jgi:hypothetical protein